MTQTSVTSLGKRELVYVILTHVFVYFTRVNFCLFLLMPGLVAADCDCGTPWTFLLNLYLQCINENKEIIL